MAAQNTTVSTNITWSDGCDNFVNAFTVDVISVIIGTFGILGNIAFLFVTARIKSLQNATNYLLVSLCVSDLIYLTAHTTLRPNWLPNTEPSWKRVICVKGTFTTSVYTTSILTLVTISIERYIGICKPMFYKTRGLGNANRIVPLIVSLWVIGFAHGFSYNLYCYFPTHSYNETATNWSSAIVMGIIYCSSIIIVVVFYSLIVRQLNLSTERHDHSKKIIKDRAQVVRLCIVTAAVFFICLFPRTIFLMAYFHYLFTNDADFYDAMICWNDLFNLVLMINSAVNPMIYNLTCELYRRAFLQAFGCRKMPPKRRPSWMATSSRRYSDMSRTYVTPNGDKTNALKLKKEITLEVNLDDIGRLSDNSV
ncbi:thyrotropin-releasing hormone receptor-like [Saccoglossus kowalevskii]|uniref:Thyrotropin-releasing hormone receptor-like n=1 Tax=Saccoglossus kowalevskii TaxID=10224 RepID=A0ABM0MLA9_SACKO|nr:PREDICTED: thyrotropin-releasing hormone receptor-like [Saccoglossus kowalevskii]